MTVTDWRRQIRRRALMAVYNLTCQHCGSPITNFGGVHFTEVGAVCERSPDTQHRSLGVPVRPPRTTPVVVVRLGVEHAQKAMAAAMRPPAQRTVDYTAPLPASVVARGASTQGTQTATDSAGRRNRGLR